MVLAATNVTPARRAELDALPTADLEILVADEGRAPALTTGEIRWIFEIAVCRLLQGEKSVDRLLKKSGQAYR